MKKCDAKSELKHEKHKRSSLKLAFYMPIRNKLRGGEFWFASCSALAIVFAKSQNQPLDRFWVAGRNAQGRWGDFWRVCDLQIEIGSLIFAL